MEELNPDFPLLGPLFRNVCARMPDTWSLQFITHSSGDQHDAHFSNEAGETYALYLGDGELGLNFEAATIGVSVRWSQGEELNGTRSGA